MVAITNIDVTAAVTDCVADSDVNVADSANVAAVTTVTAVVNDCVADSDVHTTDSTAAVAI